MTKDKYSGEQNSSRQILSSRTRMLVLSLLLILAIAVGGTLAYLHTKTDPIENTFTPSQVSCEVTEDFDKDTNIKSNVNVTNTSDIDAYIRVKLVTYRVNKSGDRIGGIATVPTFTPGDDWYQVDGYYYYSKPVEPGEQPETNLIDSIILEGNYGDVDGGRQVIEVMAEAIQVLGTDADGKTPAELSWGVDPSELGN